MNKLNYRDRLLLLAGPCQLESYDHAFKIAERLKNITSKLPIDLVFKSSFDKANRTSINSKRGLGLDEGLEVFSKIKQELEINTITDIHLPDQAATVAEVVDYLQIPAFLSRQTDLLIAAGKTNKPINIKKGQFMHANDMEHSAKKVESAGSSEVFLCERGNTFGYREIVVDMKNLIIMKQLGYQVIFDSTHSVQIMSGKGGSSGGMREFVFPLLRAAISTGVDGIFIECHDDPDNAPSDGPNMLQIENMEKVLTTACRLHETFLELQ
ncbi:UNVERIFIED_CONTAM: hypothetical protein GTU68_063527 [Idotea baltica]|nr:hypothetical protein [Idotea baltica]